MGWVRLPPVASTRPGVVALRCQTRGVFAPGGQCRCRRRRRQSGRRTGFGDAGTAEQQRECGQRTPNILCIMIDPELDRPMATGKGLRTS
jgi:hypothetical protein